MNPSRCPWSLPTLSALLIFGAALVVLSEASNDSRAQVLFPNPDIGVDALAAREKSQAETAKQFKVFYQFELTDKVRESGITFVNHAVE